MDRISEEQRSRNMSQIRSRDTKPERALRKELFRRGRRYRLCIRKLPGTPDIVFPSKRLAIQVRGCFWHQHKNCAHGRLPKSRVDYWHKKLRRNVERDEENDDALRKLGWAVIVVWECELKSADQIAQAADLVEDYLDRHEN